jgi:DNA ligase-1
MDMDEDTVGCQTTTLQLEMRTGFDEGLMEVAIAEAFKLPLTLVRTANMLRGDIGEIAYLARSQGKEGLKRLRFTIFRPVKPMLAQMASSVTEALTKHEGSTALEYKLDGARVQIHKSMSDVRIFSRRLTDVTESFPEIVQLVRDEVDADEAILEGELIATAENGRPRPFQHLMRRFKRIREIEAMAKKITVQLYLFDALFINDESLIRNPYQARRKALKQIAGSIPLTKQIVPLKASIAEGFLKEALEDGHEGLVAKRLDSPYTPGVRGKGWLKIKRILEPLDLVIVAAEYGYGRRHGWLSNYDLAARDEESGEFLTIGKTFKGLTDTEIVNMTKRLKRLKIKEERGRVSVLPRIIVEVAYNEIQKSRKYECGMALRFARITRIRDDKSLEETDTIQKVREIYAGQFKRHH